MCYILFKNIKDIEGFMTDVQYDSEGRNRTSELIFRTFVASFNKIAELIRYNRRLPFFDLKEKGADYILDTPNKSLDFIEMLGDCLEAEEIVNLLNCLNDENEQLKFENYELHKRLGDFEQFEEHIKERTSKTFVKKCVYFNSVHGVCDIDGSVDCPCENYEGLVRWIDG